MDSYADEGRTIRSPNQALAAPLKPACPICRDLDKRKVHNSHLTRYPDRAPFMGLELKFKTVQNSADRGCQLCSALVFAAKELVKPDFPWHCVHWGAGTLAIQLDTDPIQISVVLPYVSGKAGSGRLKAAFEFFTNPDKPSPWPAFLATSTAPANLHSTRRTKIVRNWIAACDASHPSCNPTLFPNDCGIPPPRRILELGKNPRTGLRLVDFSANSGPYVAVVHASLTPLEAPLSATTSNNIKDRQNNIKWWQIPVALQETITIAHEQNIRYIWIPDFCVIQDDTEDKNWHLDRQNVIYGRSHFTIALPDTKDLRIGNFVRRRSGCPNFPLPKILGIDPSQEDLYYIIKKEPFQSPIHRTITIPLSHNGQRHFIFARPSMNSDHQLLSELKLPGYRVTPADRIRFYGQDTTFQGIISSSRVLFLRGSEISWECVEAAECECEARRHNHGPPAFGAGRQYTGQPTYVDLLVEEGSRLPEMLSRKQYMLLPSANLDGKLDHISSLLRQCSQLSRPPRQMNFAGILVNSTDDLAQELLWTYTEPELHMKYRTVSSATVEVHPSVLKTYRHHTDKIPTWSWASMVLRHSEVPCRPEDMYFPFRQCMGTWSTDALFRIRGSRCDPEVGGRGDTFLAGNWVLEVSGKMATAQITGWKVVGSRVSKDGKPQILKAGMPFHPVPPIKSTYTGSFFQPDSSLWAGSINPESTGPPSKRVELLVLGRVQAWGVDLPPGCDFQSGLIDVGLVLRESSRNYATNSYERLGTFAAPADYEIFEGCSGEDIALV